MPFAGTEDALTERIIKVYYQVYNELGTGFPSLWRLLWSRMACPWLLRLPFR